MKENIKQNLKVFEGKILKVPTDQMFDDSLFGKLDLKKVTVEDTKRKNVNGEEYLLFRLSYNDSVYKMSPIVLAKGEEMNKLCKLGEYYPIKIEVKETMRGEKLFYDVITIADKLGKSYEEEVIAKLKEDIQKDMLTNDISQFRQYDPSVLKYNKKCLSEGYEFIYAPNGEFDIKKLDENHKISKTISSDRINGEEKDMLMNYYTGKETISFMAIKNNSSKEKIYNLIENLELKVSENFIIKKIHNKIKNINDKWEKNELEHYNPISFIKEGQNNEELNNANIEEISNAKITNYGLDITKLDLEVISMDACEKIIDKLEDEQYLRKEKVYDTPQSKKQFQELINLFLDLGETKEIKEEKNNKNNQETKIQYS
ncbi:hypothetical protein [Mycobacterium sp.]|uniref:hypothetical protein n=1 Tax=Mycobacterium sp. TaxID=1785 RepID=UPI003A84F797